MSGPEKIRLPQLELDCMKVLWKHPGASVAEVRAGLPRPLAYTTVMTVLDRLAAKGLVERRKNGRAYFYTAVLDLDSARRNAVGRLIANLFDGDPAALARYASRLRPEDISAAPLSPRRPATAKKTRRPVSTAAVFPSRMDDSLL